MTDQAFPPAEVIIGLDVGTTAAKAVAFGLGSTWRHTVVREYPLLSPAPGWQVQDPDTIVAAVMGALAEAVTQSGGARVIGISLSAAMHGLIGLDSGLCPLTPLVTWADTRAQDEARSLRDAGQARALHHTSGTPVHPMSPLTKLMWFSRHEPGLSASARAWVGLKDYMLLALTGTLATELSSASATGMLDLETRDWSPVATDLAGVRADQLPPILSPTSALGLSRAVASRLGLPTATPVIAGGADGPLGNLGSGAIDPGVAGLSLGTSGAVRMLVPRPALDSEGRLFCYALTEDAWVVGGAVSNGGVVVRWAGNVFGRDLTPDAEGGSPDAELLALASSVPPGSDGLLMLPYLLGERAPLWDPSLTGAFLGLRHSHTRGHFVRAAVEGVALQLSTIVDLLDGLSPVTSIRATGGVFRSALWREVVAAALGRPLAVTGGAEGSALGAAALGLLALGRGESLHGARRLLAAPESEASAEVLASAHEQEVYARIRRSLPQLLSAYAEVAELYAGSAGSRASGFSQPARAGTR